MRARTQVLTNANKKRMQELQRQQSLARRLGANPEADPPKKFVVEVHTWEYHFCGAQLFFTYRAMRIFLSISFNSWRWGGRAVAGGKTRSAQRNEYRCMLSA